MKKTLISVILKCVTLGGCRTLADAREAKGKGTTRTLAATESEVWNVLPKAVNEVDLSIAGEYREEGYLLAERGVTIFSWGEKVAVFVEPVGARQTDVEVVSMRAVAVNITAAEFGNKLLDMIEIMLADN